MAQPFPSLAWLLELKEALNRDARYAQVARNWEGDLAFVIEPEPGSADKEIMLYLDLWHGKCRSAEAYDDLALRSEAPKFILRAPLKNLMKILDGELDPMQAMLTRRLRVEGDFAYMLRHVPTVLEFVRCARQVAIAG